MNIVIVDYGMGNLRSISTTLQYLGAEEVKVSADKSDLENADKIILPGVGSFARAMARIRHKQLDLILKELVVDRQKPLLGICLGMQLLGTSSTEEGVHEGLGFVNAKVERFDVPGLPVPHVGFNQVRCNRGAKLYEGIADPADFYFTHSYRMQSEEPINQSICEYGSPFVASFEKGKIAGVQFHPELSQYNGLRLLRNFIDRF